MRNDGGSTERVWDPYLTDRDRLHVAALGPKPRVGWGAKPAVLLVDNYRGALGDGPEPILDQIRHQPWGVGEEGWAAVARIAEVVAAARAIAVPVVHVTALAADGLSNFVMGFRRGTVGNAATEGPLFEIIPELAPAPGEVVLTKASASAFFGTALEGHFRYLGVDTLIVCGETTSGCIRATVVDACSHRFRVIVPEECSYDRHEACHAINLFDMNEKYADVVPVAEVLERLTTYADAGTGTGTGSPEPSLTA